MPHVAAGAARGPRGARVVVLAVAAAAPRVCVLLEKAYKPRRNSEGVAWVGVLLFCSVMSRQWPRGAELTLC